MDSQLDLKFSDNTIELFIKGNWSDGTSVKHNFSHHTKIVTDFFESYPNASVLTFDTSELGKWDSTLLACLSTISQEAVKKGMSVNTKSLPSGIKEMLEMSLAVPPKEQQQRKISSGFVEVLGSICLEVYNTFLSCVEFIGEMTESVLRFIRGKSSVSSRDLWEVFKECGNDALPIVTLTSLLLGLILAFVSAMQLKIFGAEIYVASLVAISMFRVMGPILTGIVLAGRTGASFAAVIGSMQVNEEIDALNGFGIVPIDFLVLPRVLAMIIMTPLLALYSDIAGCIGGFLVGVLMLDISPNAFIENALEYMKVSYIWIGLFHAFVFGFIISLCGCYQGIRSGRNASAVGQATTAAVVNSIVGIIVATSIITIILTVIDL